MLAIEDKWDARPIQQICAAYEREWARADPLSDQFVRSYRESNLGRWLLQSRKRSPRRRTHATGKANEPVMVVATITTQFGNNSPVAVRVDRLLEGTANAWYRARSRSLNDAVEGRYLLMADLIDRDVCIGRIVDRRKDGPAWVVAYELLTTKRAPSLTRRLLDRLNSLGLRPTSRQGLRSQVLDATRAAEVVGCLYGQRIRAKFERTLHANAVQDLEPIGIAPRDIRGTRPKPSRRAH